MARFRFSGLKEYELKLSSLQAGTKEIAGKAIYAGAKVVADAVKESINELPIRTGYGTTKTPLRGVTEKQKEGLKESFGITEMKLEDGYYNVKLGFDGCNSVKTRQYPQGQPNQLVARGAESGTSWLQKTPFVGPAVNRSRQEAENKMKEILDKEIKERME
jgi:hypothetical protein